MLRRSCSALLLLCACSGADAPNFPSVHAIDASTQVVENAAPLWTAAERWSVRTPHRFEIGGSLENADNDLIAVKAIGRLSDGRWVIADAGDYLLKFYDTAGNHLFNAGGKGDGPGEFRFIDEMLVLPGDTIVVFDAPPGRLSRNWFDGSGRFVRREPQKYLHNSFMANTDPAHSNGFNFLGSTVVVSLMYDEPMPESGVHAPNQGYALLRPDGGLDTIGWFPGSQIRRSGRGPAQVVLFSPFSVASAGPHSLYIGNNATFEIGQYSTEGKLERVIRRDVQPQPVTRKFLRESRKLLLARMGEEDAERARALRAMWESAPRASHVPVYMELHADSEGHLWVRNMTPNDSLWSIFERDGRYLGDVVLPSTESLVAVHGDQLVTRADSRTGLGIPRLRFYELLRPQP